MVKHSIIGVSLFVLGIIVMVNMESPATEWENMTGEDYVYVSFFASSILYLGGVVLWKRN